MSWKLEILIQSCKQSWAIKLIFILSLQTAVLRLDEMQSLELNFIESDFIYFFIYLSYKDIYI